MLFCIIVYLYVLFWFSLLLFNIYILHSVVLSFNFYLFFPLCFFICIYTTLIKLHSCVIIFENIFENIFYYFENYKLLLPYVPGG